MESLNDDGRFVNPAEATPLAPPRRWRTRSTVALACGAVAGALLLGGVTALGFAGVTGALSATRSIGHAGQAGQGGSGSTQGGAQNGLGHGGFGYGSGGGSAGAPSNSSLQSATAAQQIGVVDITSELGYDQAEAAGTGLVLTSDGEILTNNHVIEDATDIRVTVVGTGVSYTAAIVSADAAGDGTGYTATVVGTDATDDIAVLKLSDVSGLATAKLDTATATVGQAVTGVGNAGGVGGTPSAAAGAVTALNQTITTQGEESAKSETLSGLIETNADIQAGDSGGPLFDMDDRVIGIDTAASADSTSPEGYAIPIATALSIADRIEKGEASASIVIGYPALLGVEVAAGADAGGAGAQVAQVISGTPAASTGIGVGDTITAVDGTAVTSADDLTQDLAAHRPGQTIIVTWTDTEGAAHSAPATLANGPAA